MNESSAELLALTRVRNPHYVRKVAAVVVVLILAFWIQGLARNKALDWPTVGHYLFNTAVLQGLQRTIIITVISIVIAVVLGAVLANMRLSSNPVLRGTSWLYIWFFRSIPLLVLLIIAYNFSLLYPRLGLGVPFGGELLQHQRAAKRQPAHRLDRGLRPPASGLYLRSGPGINPVGARRAAGSRDRPWHDQNPDAAADRLPASAARRGTAGRQ